MIVFPVFLNVGCSTPVTPSMVIFRCFCPSLHGIVEPTNTGISALLSLKQVEKKEPKMNFLFHMAKK